MNSGNQPDIDPANNGTLAGTLQFAFYKMMQNTDGMLPAQVIAFSQDPLTGASRVQVQLLIAVVTTSGGQVTRPQLASIPVLTIGGGGFVLNFKLKPGDLGFVVANDRDISLFLQNYSEAAPNTGRVKNFSDGVFIPSVMTGFTPGTDDMTLQSLDGTVSIGMSAGVINITAPVVNVNAPQVVVTATTEIDLISPLIRVETALLAAYGNITASGTITPSTPPPP